MTTTTATITATEPAGVAKTGPQVVICQVDDETTIERWGHYVERVGGGTLFHHPLWSQAVEKVFDHRPLHLVAARNGQVVGVLPLMEVRSFLAGRLLVSVPYGTHGGILAEDDEARDALAAEALQLVRQRDARLLDLRSAHADVPGLARNDRYFGFVRGLPQRSDELGAYLPRKARAAARQAREREQLTPRHDAALLPLVWRLYARNMRRLGSINYPLAFFAELVDKLGERAWITTVWRGEQPVAGLLSFVFRDTVMPYAVGVDERLRCTGAANLLYLTVMERAVERGLRQFDFGRSRKDNAGPCAFKCNQGFEPRVLGYQYHVPPGRTAPNLTPANPRFRLARRLWRHLPLSLTRPLGSWLSRSIPG